MTMAVSRYKAFETMDNAASSRHCERSEAIHRAAQKVRIASRSLSSGAYSRDPLARSDKTAAAGVRHESDRPRGMERCRQDHRADAGDPAIAATGPARFRNQ